MIMFYNEYKIVADINNYSLSIIIMTLFSFIIINNFLEPFPYIYTDRDVFS